MRTYFILSLNLTPPTVASMNSRVMPIKYLQMPVIFLGGNGFFQAEYLLTQKIYFSFAVLKK